MAAIHARSDNEIEFRRIVESSQVAALLQSKYLKFWHLPQIGVNGGGRLPMMADPGKRVEREPLVLTAESLHEVLRRLADAGGVGPQLRTFNGDADGDVRLESRPQAWQEWLIADLSADSGASIQFAVKLEAKRQQFFVGQVESITNTVRNRLEKEIFQEPASR